MKLFLFLVSLGISYASLASDEFGFRADGSGISFGSTPGGKYQGSKADLFFPLYRDSSGFIVSPTLGLVTLQTNTGQFNNIIVDDKSKTIASPDGSAQYVTAGVQASYPVLSFSRARIEAVIAAFYAKRTGGTTTYHHQLRGTETYDPLKGINLSVGGRLNYLWGNNNVGIGLEWVKNPEQGSSQIYLKLSFEL